MPFYNAREIKKARLQDPRNPEGNPGEYQPLAGELMKAGVVTYPKATGSKP
ncbi:MAG: hypothetical protein HOC91_18530, partial [Nitrospinaceae bacterium]|nr:hypothetical protein [Nitrospinaceae bacterium]